MGGVHHPTGLGVRVEGEGTATGGGGTEGAALDAGTGNLLVKYSQFMLKGLLNWSKRSKMIIFLPDSVGYLDREAVPRVRVRIDLAVEGPGADGERGYGILWRKVSVCLTGAINGGCGWCRPNVYKPRLNITGEREFHCVTRKMRHIEVVSLLRVLSARYVLVVWLGQPRLAW